MKRLAISLASVLALLVVAAGAFLWRQARAGADLAFFESEIAAFEAADAEQMPEAGGIVFVGSSSIWFWSSLQEDMAPLPVIQRGFGGAHMEHVVHNARRIVTPYAPRAVVVFVGGNDVGFGKDAARVARDYRTFLGLVHAELPETEVWILSMKPSKLRWSQWGQLKELDAMLLSLAEADPRVYLVATGRTLLGPDGMPDDVYIFDGLHLAAAGYERWTAILKPLLMAAYGANPRS